MRYLIQLSYDGSEFWGWQKQAHGRTVQTVMEQVVEQFSGKPVAVVASGRTDTGVHATAQYAHFDYDGKMERAQMLKAFNRWLPDDVKVLRITTVAPDFSARYQAYERTYKYLLVRQRTPFNRLYTAHVPWCKLHLAPMQEAAQRFLGSHNFSSFGRMNPEVPNHICDLQECSISEDEGCFTFIVRADRFLHNMVRRMVGTLINISHFELPPDTIDKLFRDECPRQNLVFTAPAEGLYLIDVKYPADLLDWNTGLKNLDSNEVNHEV